MKSGPSPVIADPYDCFCIKTASDLKYWIKDQHPDNHFFDRDTMKFFGDSMANFGLRKVKVKNPETKELVACYELYRKRAVKHGLQSSHYFDARTLKTVYGEKVA